MYQLSIFRNFYEDNRKSMELYADEIVSGLQENHGNQYNLVEFRPERSAAGIRWSRYINYPIVCRSHLGEINHIMDHAYAHLLPVLKPEKTVITVHDLIPWLLWQGKIVPGNKKWKRIPALNLFSFSFLRRARHLISVSSSTKHDLIRFGCHPESIHVIHQGVSSAFYPFPENQKKLAARKMGFQEDNARRILVTGTQIYKNHFRALGAFRILLQSCDEPLKIIRAGLETPEWIKAVKQFGLSEHQMCIKVEKNEMPLLYNAVDCLFFPSLYEGFGLPPLEAMACGLPVVTSNAGAICEVVGNAAMSCSPLNEAEMAEALYQVLTDGNLSRKKIQIGLDRAKRFSWEETVNQTSKVYEKIIEDQNRI